MTATIFSFPPMARAPRKPVNRIGEWRAVRGLTQEKLGELLGCGQNTISRIEGGDRGITIETLRRFAKALGVDVGQLLAVEDNAMGLDEQGARLVRLMQDDKELAATLSMIADTMASHTKSAPLASTANDDEERRRA